MGLFVGPSRGVIKALSEEALPVNTASTVIFGNVPSGCMGASLQINTGSISVTFDGTTVPILNSVGEILSAVTTYDFGPTDQVELAKIRGIGGATGWITYWGAK